MAKRHIDSASFGSVRFIKILGRVLGNLMVVLGVLAMLIALILVFVGLSAEHSAAAYSETVSVEATSAEGETLELAMPNPRQPRGAAAYFFAAACFAVGGIVLILGGLFVEFTGRLVDRFAEQIAILRQAKASKDAVERITPTAEVDDSGVYVPTAARSDPDSVIVDIGLSDRLRSMVNKEEEADDGATMGEDDLDLTEPAASDRLIDAYGSGEHEGSSRPDSPRNDEGLPREPILTREETAADSSQPDQPEDEDKP